MHDRPPSFAGVASIPFTAIDAYARRYEIEGDDFAVLAKLIRVCDAEFVAVMSEKAKAKEVSK